jgi:RNA polymerase sigma factor (TIGR02999 family)
MSDVTRILSKIESGDQQAAEELLPLVYDELRKLAAARMANERADHTLSATALVHEAYVRLVDVNEAQKWDSRRHFYWSAAEAMRRILVEHARRKLGKKRGGNLHKVEFDGLELVDDQDANRILEVQDALERLEEADVQTAELIKLRFFSGLSIPEAAEVLEIPRATAYVRWDYAKAVMARMLLGT